ncbi:MAG: EamA family transporter RarD [Acidimicrobiia bacterium]
MDDERRGFLTGNAAYILWGLLTLYWHELTGLDAFGLIAWRIVWSVVVLAILLTFAKRWSDLRGLLVVRRLLPTAVAAIALATNWTTYVWCVTHGRVIETALGYFLAPIGLVLVGVVMFHERLRRAQAIALVLCGLAVVVLAVGYGSPPYFALLIAVSWTTYGVSKKRAALPPLEGLAAETIVLTPVAVGLLLVMQLGGSPSLEGASALQLVLVPLTGLATTVPLLLFAYSARRIPLTMLGWLQYWVPTINLVLGVAVYDEAMPAWRIAGFTLVWIALALITVDGVRASRSSPTAPPVETLPIPLEG